MNKKRKSPQAIKGADLSPTMTIEQLEAVMTLQQIEFCREYVLTLSARQAAENVGYRDYNRLLVNPKVKLYISALQKRLAEKWNLSADMVLQELCKIGFVDPGELYDEDGTLIKPHKLPRKIRGALAEITEEMVGFDKATNKPLMKMKYKFHNKVTALDLLAKHLGLYERDNNQKKSANVMFVLPSNGRDPGLDANRKTISLDDLKKLHDGKNG